MNPPRLLFVDDEPNIRLTLPQILRMHGFEVTAAATVPEALAQIHAERFDILIADLNIGQPGDGFTVVSAMRRTQPKAVTIIMTGFPAFETALQAIRGQVDDYIVKPATVDQLLQVINEKLKNNTPTHHIASFKHAATVLRENNQMVINEWLALCKSDPLLGALKISDDVRARNLPQVIEEVTHRLETNQGQLSDKARKAAAEHGRLRNDQGFSVAMVLAESNLLRHVMSEVVQQNLLAMDISYVISELIGISDAIDQQLSIAVESFVSSERLREVG